MGWITNVLRTFIYVRLTCENHRYRVDRFNFKTLSRISRVPMIPEDIIGTIHEGDLQWSVEDGSGGMIQFKGDESILMENMSASETF